MIHLIHSFESFMHPTNENWKAFSTLKESSQSRSRKLEQMKDSRSSLPLANVSNAAARKKRSTKSTFTITLIFGICLLTLNSFISSSIVQWRSLFRFHNADARADSVEIGNDIGNKKYVIKEAGGDVECSPESSIKDVEECLKAGTLLGLSMAGENSFVKGEWTHTPRGCFSNNGQLHFSSNSIQRVMKQNKYWKSYALICKADPRTYKNSEKNKINSEEIDDLLMIDLTTDSEDKELDVGKTSTSNTKKESISHRIDTMASDQSGYVRGTVHTKENTNGTEEIVEDERKSTTLLRPNNDDRDDEDNEGDNDGEDTGIEDGEESQVEKYNQTFPVGSTSDDDTFEFFSFDNDQESINIKEMHDDAKVDLSPYEKFEYPSDPSRDEDKNCPFLQSSLYRSVYVYPTWMDEADGWYGPILSKSTNITKWPWLDIDKNAKEGKWGHYGPASNQMGQYTLELIVREIMTHPDSCLRTMNPLKATLFYVPYLPSTEFHNGKLFAQDYSTSPYATAIETAIEGKYDQWEKLFGLTSDFWKRKSGADHILVFSEPLHGLSHPRNRRGSHHFIHTQKMLTPPIIVSVEVSTSFVNMYPKCSAKNIVVPYPNSDGNWLNGNFDREAVEHWGELLKAEAFLEAEKEILSIASSSFKANQTVNLFQPRPVAQYYSAGKHGTCSTLRKNMGKEYACTASSKAHAGKIPYHRGMRVSTFCPCPGGDSPSAKRMFDAVNAGCIPVILSHDYVWPYTSEADPSISIDPTLFALRWNTSDFEEAKLDSQCMSREKSKPTFQAKIEEISAEEITRLRRGLRKASSMYSYWSANGYEGHEFPLIKGILPDGGASKALVKLLGHRAKGSRWPECKTELKNRVEGNDPTTFYC